MCEVDLDPQQQPGGRQSRRGGAAVQAYSCVLGGGVGDRSRQNLFRNPWDPSDRPGHGWMSTIQSVLLDFLKGIVTCVCYGCVNDHLSPSKSKVDAIMFHPYRSGAFIRDFYKKPNGEQVVHQRSAAPLFSILIDSSLGN